MKQTLFSELRTIYETSYRDPHTFRLSIKMKDLIDGAILRHAAYRTMERYPYFLVRMRREGADIFYESNPLPFPVIETNGRITLGAAETNYHLMAFCYWQNWLHIDCYHALTDGGGIDARYGGDPFDPFKNGDPLSLMILDRMAPNGSYTCEGENHAVVRLDL